MHAQQQSVGIGTARNVYFYGAGWSESGPVSRSGSIQYLEQVRDIAPVGGLVGRERELADMDAFCRGPGSYWCWRAEPWAGKSALMSWFVLHPPPGIAIVSFFVTSRYAAQDDSTAFTLALSQQLEQLLGHDFADHQALAGDGHLFCQVLLRDTARRYHEQGMRLVLVVDGLDEDRGPDAGRQSVASMLPKDPASGLKVFVSARPNPRLPRDVPADHPLRDDQVMHALHRSRHALVVRDAAELELRGLLSGNSEQRDLLGLLTAAIGGLTLSDLSHLTGLPPFTVSEVLRGSTGRAFSARRSSPANSTDENEVYLLAHEALQAEAARSLGEELLTTYRNRLHSWAGRYRALGWPPGTPGYLLHGYFSMLSVVGDTERIVACATDNARHDRLLVATGGDTSALAEISAGQENILAQPDPDLPAMARLAFHRDRIRARNTYLPVRLPAVWVQLGEPDHAEALALSAADPTQRAMALTWAALALERNASHEHALKLASAAVRAAVTEPDQRFSWRWLPDMAVVLANAGLHEPAAQAADRAEHAALAMAGPNRASALCHSVHALAMTGRLERARQAAKLAEAAVRPAEDTEWNFDRGSALREVVAAYAVAGLSEHAEALTQSRVESSHRDGARAAIAAALANSGAHAAADRVAHSVADPLDRALVLAELSKALGATDPQRAAKLAREAHDFASSATNPHWLARVMTILSQADRHLEAVQLADNVSAALREVSETDATGDGPDATVGIDRYGELQATAETLASTAQVFAAAGRDDRASQAATLAEKAMRSLGNSDLLERVATGLAAARLLHRAESLIETANATDRQARALTAVATELLKQGSSEVAARVASKAETTARHVTADGYALAHFAAVLASAGMPDRAKAVARSIIDPESRATAQHDIAAALTEVANYSQAAILASEIRDPRERVRTLVMIAETLARKGLQERAEQTAELAVVAARLIIAAYAERFTVDAEKKAAAAIGADCQTLAEAGLYEQAADMAKIITGSRGQVSALVTVAEQLAGAGQHLQAHDLALSISDPASRSTVLAAVSQKQAHAGLYDQAADTARAITRPDKQGPALVAVAEQLAGAGQHLQARDLALSISDPASRSTALMAISVKLTEAGLYDQAEAVGKSPELMHHRAWALSDLARALASAGLNHRASKIAEEAANSAFSASGDPIQKTIVLAEVTIALTAAGMHHQASAFADHVLTTATSCYGTNQQLLALTNAAQVFLTGGLRQHADRVADQAKTVADNGVDADDPGHSGSLIGASWKLAKIGLYSQAEAIANSLADSRSRGDALSNMSRMLTHSGLYDQAERIALSIDHPSHRSWALTGLAEKFVAQGRYERAETAVKSIQDTGDRSEALASLAAMLATAGQHDHAEAIARSIAHPMWQAEALTAVAQTLIPAGKHAKARHLVALAWTVDSWDGPLEVLPSLAPQALLALSAECGDDPS